MPTYAVTVIEREGPRLRVRCRSVQDQDAEVADVTRSFVVAMLAELPGSPMSAALAARGVAEIPLALDEAERALGGVLDELVRSTRVVRRQASRAPDDFDALVARLRELAGDPELTWASLHTLPAPRREELLTEVDAWYELEAELVEPGLAEAIEPGQVFETRARDLVWEDPTNPLASEADRARWRQEWDAARSSRDAMQAAAEARCREVVARWLADGDASALLEVSAERRERVIRAVGSALHRGVVRRGEAPEVVAMELAEWMMDSPDIEEIHASDLVLRGALTELAHRV